MTAIHRIAIVTGANKGIGLEIPGWHLWCRATTGMRRPRRPSAHWLKMLTCG